jgi:hypothetical protein
MRVVGAGKTQEVDIHLRWAERNAFLAKATDVRHPRQQLLEHLRLVDGWAAPHDIGAQGGAPSFDERAHVGPGLAIVDLGQVEEIAREHDCVGLQLANQPVQLSLAGAQTLEVKVAQVQQAQAGSLCQLAAFEVLAREAQGMRLDPAAVERQQGADHLHDPSPGAGQEGER